MIALMTADGRLIRSFPTRISELPREGERYGYHSIFGFIGERSFASRLRMRHLHGHAIKNAKSWVFQILVKPETGKADAAFQVEAAGNCKVAQLKNAWMISTPMGELRLAPQADAGAISPAGVLETWDPEDPGAKRYGILALLFLLLFVGVVTFFRGTAQEVAPQIIEPITVNIDKPVEKTVKVPEMKPEETPIKTQDKVLKRAIHENLGFLGILGKKELKGALGGMPTVLKNASAGAGAGGLEGSGGETLVGLGQGVKRTTVGNTGTAGLGGIGTKGAGGGLGGYGNAMVGSGEGKTLSSIPLSRDMVLEGGLDRAVILATIAKYQSQVRACYEAGLQRRPDISGSVAMKFEINATGALNFANVLRSTLGDSGVEGCISTKMMTWMFPRPKGGVKVPVEYPFILRPQKL